MSVLSGIVAEQFRKETARVMRMVAETEMVEERTLPAELLRNNLKRARELKGLTQVQLSKMSGLHDDMIAHYEVGNIVPSFGNIYAVCLALGVTLDSLLRDNDAEENQYEKGFQDGLKAAIQRLTEMQ